jgi:hypothetical protein
MAPDGEVVGRARVPDGIEGVRRIHDLVATAAPEVDEAEPVVVVGIETDRGLLVRALLASGYEVIAVNPMAAARYRDRFFVSGAKPDAAEYQEILRRPALEQPPRLAATYGQIARSLVEVIVATTGQIAHLEEVLTEDFSAHPDADIYRSLPGLGLGIVTGARVLGELGDDPERYVSAKARKNAAGTSPLTVA